MSTIIAVYIFNSRNLLLVAARRAAARCSTMFAQLLRSAHSSALLAYGPGLVLAAGLALGAMLLGALLGNAITWALLLGMALAAFLHIHNSLLPGIAAAASG